MGIGLALHIGADEPVVAVHGLTEVVGERDEVTGAEDVHRLAEADCEAFVHIVPDIHDGQRFSQSFGDGGLPSGEDDHGDVVSNSRRPSRMRI